MIRSFCCLVLIMISLVSCKREKVVCYVYNHTPIEGWEQHNVQTFQIDTIREDGYYDFSVCLRNTNSYPFQSLWLLVQQHFLRPDTVMQDTVVCYLTDLQGNQQGKGFSIYQNEYPFRRIYLGKGCEAVVSVSHIMRRNILPGISDVGLLVKKEN